MSALADRFTLDILKLIKSGALEGSFADFVRLSGKSLDLRTQRYHEWRRNRLEHGVWPFSTQLQSTPGPEATVIDEARQERTGVNFASQDYLGLAAHDVVLLVDRAGYTQTDLVAVAVDGDTRGGSLCAPLCSTRKQLHIRRKSICHRWILPRRIWA